MKQMNQNKPRLLEVDALVNESFSKIRKIMLKNKNYQEVNMAISRLAQELFYQSVALLQANGMPEDDIMIAIEAYCNDAKHFAKTNYFRKKNEIH